MLLSSSIDELFVVKTRFSGCIRELDECIRCPDWGKLVDDIRESVRFPLNNGIEVDDSLRIDGDERSIVLKLDMDDEIGDGFAMVLR